MSETERAARTAATPEVSSYRFVIGGLLLAVQVVLGLNWVAITPLFPLIMEEYSIDRGTVSLLFSLVPIAQAALTVPAGILGAKLGLKLTLGLGVWGMASGLILLFSSEFALALVARLLFGVGTGFCTPLIGAVVAQWFRPKELPLMNGLGFVCGSFGVSLGLFITVPLSDALSWRGALALFAFCAAAVALAWTVLGREAAPYRPLSTTSAPEAAITDVLKMPATYWLAFAFAFPICFYDVMVAWLPTYYNQVFGMELAAAAGVTGLLGLMGIPASLLGGVLPSRIGLRRPFLAVPGALIGFLGVGTFLVNETWVIIPFVLLFGFFSWSYTPVLFTIPMEMPGLRPAMVGVVNGVILAIAGIATFAAPLIVGVLTDMTGSYLPGFFLFAAGSFVLLLAAFKLPETGPRARRVTV